MSDNLIPFLRISDQNNQVREDLMRVFEEVLDSGIYVSGERVSKFEEEFSKAHDVPFAVACNSGTSALILSLQALGIKPGDEVLVPGMTFIATIEAVVASGGVPVIVDVDEKTWNLDASLAKKFLTPRTKAMVFVHLHGNPAGIIEARDFCDKNDLLLIEDAAQAHLAEINGEKVGNFGGAAAFSFYPGKNLGALGEGGCLLTHNSEVAEKAKLIRNWGARKKYVHEIRGTNFRMDEIQAAFLSIKLNKLNAWTRQREQLSGIYDEFFDSVGVQRPSKFPDIRHVYHLYSILIDNRSELQEFLIKNGIESGIHYPAPISNMEPWKVFVRKSNANSMPVSEKLSNQFLSLPISELHTFEEIKRITEVIEDFLKYNM